MLRFRIRPRPRKMSSLEGLGSGPYGRLKRLRKIVTGLVRHERLELPHGQADEARGYAERLIQIAMQQGDRHKPTMELADYWLLEKDLVHKLFKVLVPRYQNSPSSYTQMWNLPTRYPGAGGRMAVLELKGNPWPPVKARQRDTKYLLSNVLLDAARHEFYAERKRAGEQPDGGEHDTVDRKSDEGRTQTGEADTVTFSKGDNDVTSEKARNDVNRVSEGLKKMDLKPT